ncbi:MAG: TetR/AcrR family transcriptional regulator [Acidimicrobiia bacterium]
MNVVPAATTAPEGHRTRAVALPAEERRAHIIEATLPLLLEHGATVTSRQIAEAAGIAEGTIFRVFPDKDSLFDAVVDAALDTASVNAALDAIDASLPLEDRLVAAVDILRRRVADVLQLRAIVGPRGDAPSTDLTKIAAVFEPDAARLRRTPIEAAHLLRGLTLAGTHPALIHDEPLSSTEIVSLLLDGVRAPSMPPRTQEPIR